MSLQLLVILVPVLFGLMGFAIDLGRLYLIRGELNQAANASALAAAAQLAGTSSAADTNITNAAQQAINPTNGNRYNFGGTVIPAVSINCFPDLLSASTNATGSTTDCASPPPVFVQASISVPAPLLFWRFLPGNAQTGTTTVASYAVAGMSSPLCTGCGIVPFGVRAPDASGADPIDWGFVQNSLYTFYYSCTGTAPAPLAGTAVPYIVLNRVDPNFDESDQMFRQGAQGIQGAAATTTNPNACLANTATPFSCVNIGDIEQAPTSGLANPTACNAATQGTDVTAALCGVESRLDTSYPGNCTTDVTDFSSLSAAFQPDPDPAYYTDYSGYSGNGRRLITVAVLGAIPTDNNASCGAAAAVVGFRQFLINPSASDGATFSPTDPNGRFVALYVGSVAPIAQGWFDSRYASSCQVNGTVVGPGKVVLHQ
jgi:Flp pilus assembly protein TadG